MKLKLLCIILLSLPLQVGQEFKMPKRVSKPLKLELTIHSTENYNTTYEQGEISCLALTVYGEIGNLAKRDKDITAIAHVVLNRVGHKMFRKPSGVCEVVLQRGQFEPLSRMRGLRYAIVSSASGTRVVPKNFDRNKWKRVYNLSKLVYNGHIDDITKGAIGFYAPKAQSRLGRKSPSWAKRLEFVASIGGHNFYR
jgi:spore germination cell wall hydrolase CwlJ-like protein